MRAYPLVLLCSIFALPAWAALKPVSEAAIALSMDGDCEFQVQSQSRCELALEMRVLNEAGRQSGPRTFSYKNDSSFEILEAYTVTPAGKRVPVPAKDIQHGDVPGESGFSGDRFVKIAFPEMSIGSRHFVRYRQTDKQIKPFAAMSDSFELGGVPVINERLEAKFRADVPLYWRAANADGLFAIKTADAGKQLQISLKQPVYRDTDEEHRRLALRNNPRIEVSTEPDATRYFAPVGAAFAKELAASLPAKAAAAVKAAQGQSWQQQVNGILTDINSRIRYMGDWRLTENGFVPFSLAEIEQRGFGDCKDMALTLAAMLRGAGFDADVAFIRAANDNTPYLMNAYGYFNHAIVHLQVDGRSYWLDPTLKANALGVVPFWLQERPAMVVGKDGSLQTVQVPRNDYRENSAHYELDLYRDAAGKWTMQGQAALTPQVARDSVEEELAKGQKQARKSMAESLLVNDMVLADEQVDSPAVQRLVHQPFRFTAKGTVSKVSNPVGNLNMVDLRVNTTRVKETQQYYALKGVSDFRFATDSYVSITRLHGVRPLAAVAACEVKSRWIDYSVSPLELAGGIGLQQKVARKAFWIPSAELHSAEFKKMIDELEKCDRNAQILLAP